MRHFGCDQRHVFRGCLIHVFIFPSFELFQLLSNHSSELINIDKVQDGSEQLLGVLFLFNCKIERRFEFLDHEAEHFT